MPCCHNCFASLSRCSLANSRQPGPCSNCRRTESRCEPHLIDNSHGDLVRTPFHSPQRRATRSQTSTTLGDVPLTLTPQPRELREIHIGIDTGSEFTKASFQIHFPDGPSGVEIEPLRTVIWRNNELSVLTQAAIAKSGELIWGQEVTRQLKAKQITEAQVVRRLKPLLLNDDYRGEQNFQALVAQLVKPYRESKIPESLQHYGEDLDDHQSAEIILYSEYLGLVYRTVLAFIAKTDGSLGWPVHENLNFYKSFKPPGDVKMSVSLPIPAGALPGLVTRTVVAARAAGVPNPYPVAEPACALLYRLSRLRGQSIIGKVFLTLDLGAGSADLQVWRVEGHTPLRLKEIVVPDHIKTVWCGGSYINDDAVKLVMRKIANIDRVLDSLRATRSPITDKASLERKLNRKFEKAKKDFAGQETIYLRIHGLPDIPEYGMPGGNMVTLNPEDVKQAFANCFRWIVSMTDTAVEHISKGPDRRAGQRQVDEITVIGGSFRSPYLYDKYRKRYATGFQASFGYPIPVTLPCEAAEVSTINAHGAVLLSVEKRLIKERQVRRSFCASRHEEVNLRLYPPESVHHSEQDGRKRVQVTRFLIKKGLYPQVFHAKPLRGWRGLLPKDFEDDGTCLVEEILYYSDTLSEDGLWICPELDLHPMPKPLSFHITLEDAERFPRLKGRGGIYSYELQYELLVTLDGHILKWKFVIPRSGKWPKTGNRHADVMYKDGQYDTTGVSQLFAAS